MSLSMKGSGLALAGTLVILFVLCAIAQMAFPSLQASHMWISLFTAAPLGSATAWIEGILASVVIGLIAGFVFAWIYNKTAARS